MEDAYQKQTKMEDEKPTVIKTTVLCRKHRPPKRIKRSNSCESSIKIYTKSPKTGRYWGKYGKKYNKSWETEEGLKTWILPVAETNRLAYCKFCRCTLRAHHSDLLQHMKTEKHKKNIDKFLSSSLGTPSTRVHIMDWPTSNCK